MESGWVFKPEFAIFSLCPVLICAIWGRKSKIDVVASYLLRICVLGERSKHFIEIVNFFIQLNIWLDLSPIIFTDFRPYWTRTRSDPCSKSQSRTSKYFIKFLMPRKLHRGTNFALTNIRTKFQCPRNSTLDGSKIGQSFFALLGIWCRPNKLSNCHETTVSLADGSKGRHNSVLRYTACLSQCTTPCLSPKVHANRSPASIKIPVRLLIAEFLVQLGFFVQVCSNLLDSQCNELPTLLQHRTHYWISAEDAENLEISRECGC